jgi:hypothetical protein
LARHLTYANVMSTVAVFIALGGASYAAFTEPLDVNVPAAGAEDQRAARFRFDGETRVSVGQQRTNRGGNPGSGFVEVVSGDGNRDLRLTHYQYGSTIRARGSGSHVFEFFLGDDPLEPPVLSVRGNESHAGAQIQARDALDRMGLALDFRNANRPRLTVVDGARLQPGARLAIENTGPNGSLALATAGAGGLFDWVTLDSGGLLTARGDLALGDSANDAVRFHGSSGTGEQGVDPGTVRDDLRRRATASPARTAAAINETRRALNALRNALRDHGLIG